MITVLANVSGEEPIGVILADGTVAVYQTAGDGLAVVPAERVIRLA